VLETERLAAIEETTTALAHESRNALQRIKACLTLLRLRSDTNVQELFDDVDDALGQLQRLYEEFRIFAAPLPLKRRRVNLEKLLHRTWKQLEVQWQRKGLHFTVQRDDRFDVIVRADPGRLGQVFMNVIEKAIQASPDEAEILALIRHPGEGNEGVAITIQDQGPGVPAAVSTRAFDLLYTTKPGGTGMGLVIAQRIVREHRGHIELEESQVGARVRIVLPRMESTETP
jgi:signal transduction histidine kinase